METPSPGKVAHQGPSLGEVSSSHGGTQRNGDHCFLGGVGGGGGGEDDPGGYWWPPVYSTLTPTIVSFSFSVSLIVAQFTIFGNFWVLNFWSCFEALNNVFWASTSDENESMPNLDIRCQHLYSSDRSL
jgi:hypothetical protein